jgi:hypothetical protein
MNNSVEQPCSKCSRDNAANKGTQKESHHHPVVQTGRIRKVQKTHSVLVGVVDGNDGAESFAEIIIMVFFYGLFVIYNIFAFKLPLNFSL